jgi:dihydroflavonol-4-reductase
MKVLVTGATGFIGSHAARALHAAGFAVRVLVRSAEKAERVLGAHAIPVEIAVGDMTDPQAVDRALDGCDAVLHAAATMYGGEDVLAANVAGVRNALGLAHARKIDPILYVSTVAAMYPPPGALITVDDPITGLRTTYGRSKAEGERFARALQAQGAPVVTLYPAGVYGPDDPGPGEPMKGLRDGLRIGWPITSGGVSIVDVRDVAQIAVAALESGRGPRRFMAAGRFLSWPEKVDLCDAITGVRARRIPAPAPLLRAVGRALDIAKRVVAFDYPLTYEAARMMTKMVPCDSRATRDELGVDFRPTRETLADAIRWLFRVGELEARHAGKLAAASSAAQAAADRAV